MYRKAECVFDTRFLRKDLTGNNMYKINDTILYGAQGACRIVGIEEKEICRKKHSYYVLQPTDGSKCTIYAPVGEEEIEKKMRRLLSAQEIYEIIEAMPDAECVWIDDEKQRKEHYKKVLADGDRAELVRLIKEIYIHKQELKKQRKKLHISDERFFKDAEKILYNEFAAVLNIKPSEVLAFITEKIGR